ncbi:hypothetical protein [Streptomyces endophytica]|uniref:Uncharacterized protein n=1 Tax=Streptomyces endophytica TaxID=2991496 RepID=A0ABY6P9G9_9ACTN|nr:hypothetical protein [Streptomyces endophytica]UZJ30242.1 hypothetical protein OJ254_07300 [Streptomyces endophytica]
MPDVDDRAAEQPIPDVREDAEAGFRDRRPAEPWLNSLRTVRLAWQHYLL